MKELQATSRAYGVRVKIEIPTFTAEALREDAEHELLVDEAEADLEIANFGRNQCACA